MFPADVRFTASTETTRAVSTPAPSRLRRWVLLIGRDEDRWRIERNPEELISALQNAGPIAVAKWNGGGSAGSRNATYLEREVFNMPQTVSRSSSPVPPGEIPSSTSFPISKLEIVKKSREDVTGGFGP
ncbi:hypothetical protein VTN77DRAFT_2649 [Rasamsonia byssochlamydoides]|uniref:uncharacterized protein n=1 Tax=Rasamsonia byssochlamydoides TaxID=89139 RepID=UPI0037430DF9